MKVTIFLLTIISLSLFSCDKHYFILPQSKNTLVEINNRKYQGVFNLLEEKSDAIKSFSIIFKDETGVETILSFYNVDISKKKTMLETLIEESETHKSYAKLTKIEGGDAVYEESITLNGSNIVLNHTRDSFLTNFNLAFKKVFYQSDSTGFKINGTFILKNK